MNFFKCVFQGLLPHFQKSCTSERIFHRTAISVKDSLVSVFCIPCELKTPNLAIFSIYPVLYILQYLIW